MKLPNQYSIDKTCGRCVLDTTVKDIWFDKEGECKYCKIHDELEKAHPMGPSLKTELDKVVFKIKKAGKNKKYDCIAGVSGGRDSTYVLLTAKRLGLRPLAVHFDNGWNSDISVRNIKNACNKLNIDLETYVIDYEEIKDLLRSYMRAGLPWVDNPTDQAIRSILFKIAKRENVKYILVGTDFRSEGKQPTEWTYSDTKQLKYIHKKYGDVKLKTYPLVSFPKYIYYGYLKKIKVVQPFNYLKYNKQDAQELIIEKYDWKYYGEHHHENLFTKWVIGYWLYEKFKIDKRIITYSAQVLSGRISRKEAIDIAKKKPYKIEKIDSETKYVLKKLSISQNEFDDIWNKKNKSFLDYPSYYKLIRKTTKILLPLLKHFLFIKPKFFYEMEQRK
jgi:N-acetyl sugar amidotransferase